MPEKAFDGPMIYGKLSNEPADIASLALNDPVTLKVAEIEDWMYTDGRNTFGGFQSEVLRRREQ